MSERIFSYSMKDRILGKKELVFLPGLGELTVIRPETPADVVNVSGLLGEHYTNRATFNHAVVNFGNFFDGMKGAVPIEKRWGINQPIPEEVTVLANNPAMNSMTRIANTPGAYGDSHLKKQYRENLGEALETIKSSQVLNPKATMALSSRIGWQTRILTNRVYHWLNEHLYVLVTPEEKIWQEISGGNPDIEIQAGGDAGDLTEIA